MTPTLLLGIIGCLLIALLLTRSREQARIDAWDSLPNLTLQVEADRLMREDACEGAALARLSGDYAESRRLLTLAYQHIVEVTPGRVARLKAIAQWARFAAAIIPPVDPGAFHLRRLSLLSNAGLVLDYVAVGAPERLWLRCAVLVYGFRLAVRVMTRHLPTAAEKERAWRKLCQAFEDWGVLDVEHLRTARVRGEE